MMVTEEQLTFIKNYVIREGVTNIPLQEDLVDHFSCIVESKMSAWMRFQEAFEEATIRISPNGAREIEEDLNYLSTIKQKIMIRKVVYIFGFMALTMCMMGVALRIPGIIDAEVSRLMIMAGILTCTFSVVPYVFYQFYKKSIDKLQES